MTIKEQTQEDIVKMEQKFNYKFSDNEIAIKGKNIQVSKNGYTIMMLHPQDPRNFRVGYDTICDFSYGRQGESSLFFATSEPYAGIAVVVESRLVSHNGNWINESHLVSHNGNWTKAGVPCEAMIYMWADKDTDTLVFDCIEFRHNDVKKIQDIITEYAAEMPYKNIHLGMGYNQQLQNPKMLVKESEMATRPDTKGSGQSIYSNYHPNAMVIKRDGVMLISSRAKVKEANIIPPSKYDENELSKEEDMEEER